MTARRTGTVTLFVGLALAVVACSGSASTSGPTSAPATENPAPATQAPGFSGLPDFSFALPSFTPDTELEALFPKEINGKPLQIQSMSGSDFLTGSNPAGDAIAPVLTQLGKQPSDLSVGFGGTDEIAIIAFRIKGVPADQFLTAYTQTAAQGATITDASFGGKSVKKVVVADQPEATYLYLKNDVIWTVSGSAVTDAILTEAFSKLP
jgi:hypothetical protein